MCRIEHVIVVSSHHVLCVKVLCGGDVTCMCRVVVYVVS